ncbi:Protein IDA-LIKE 2 [Dendrobium catenatum]|uniref:Protein IDA-LIKE 2 n=2 Tax=Dendrobium TaxID=37818 RepID=A0A2I0W3R4_9ASPA|nr:Protein IDA-LIKE 2 [Dendrobium catenatum]
MKEFLVEREEKLWGAWRSTKAHETGRDAGVIRPTCFELMGRLSRGLLGLLLLLLAASSLCSGARKVQDFNNLQPGSSQRNPSLFFGFLPRAMPIPPSGPSKQHNSVGLQSSGRG